jgi:hypothetical protein
MIRFSSSAAADLSMFDSPARELLRMAGRLEADRGAIGADEVAGALQALRSALAALPAPPPEPEKSAKDGEDETPGEPEVGLRQRAWPLVDMLERAARKNVAVLWEKT